MRAKLKNCDLPYGAVVMMHRRLDDREAGVGIFFIISRQMTPLFFVSSTRSKIARRIRRKSQSTSRTFSPNSSFTVWW